MKQYSFSFSVSGGDAALCSIGFRIIESKDKVEVLLYLFHPAIPRKLRKPEQAVFTMIGTL
ncbi:penicillin-binding protein 1A [Streptococcus ruminantium]|uniref:Penicillin-binding protein 1A n=1 Tax=Streptococcus ruminantium TaxID=1917441 RepID=A0A2Z5U5C6_9STRE|nr:penicillin-binding protein 1A [Streptococcus ruminantium]